MSGLFEQPKAEAVLQRLQEASSRHDKELALFKKIHDFSPSEDDCSSGAEGAGGMIMRKLQSIESTLKSLDSRVALIEEAIQIPTNSATSDGARGVTIGQGVANNRRTLARAFTLLSAKASVDEVEKSRASLNQAIVEASEELKLTVGSIGKSNEAITSLSQLISTLSQRIDVLSAEMKTKANDSDIKMIEKDASLISQHSQFQRTTNEAIGTTQSDLKVHDEAISKHSEEISTLATGLSSLQTELDLRASMVSLNALQQEVGEISSELPEKVQRSDFDSLLSNFQANDATTARLVQDLQSVVSSQRAASTHFSSQLREHRDAVGQVVSGCASRDALATMQVQLERVEQLLSELSVEHQIAKKQAALASQFIAWYSNNVGSIPK